LNFSSRPFVTKLETLGNFLPGKKERGGARVREVGYKLLEKVQGIYYLERERERYI